MLTLLELRLPLIRLTAWSYRRVVLMCATNTLRGFYDVDYVLARGVIQYVCGVIIHMERA